MSEQTSIPSDSSKGESPAKGWQKPFRWVRRGVRQPAFLASLIAAVAVVWMASGALISSDARQNAEEQRAAAKAFTVGVRVSRAREMTRAVTVQGALEAARSVTVRAEIAGRVEAVLVKKGARVQKGDPIIRLAAQDRTTALAKAKAQLAQATRDYEASRRLGKKGYQTEARIAALKAQLEAARAAVDSAELAMRQLVIRAPFGGVLNTRPVEIGDYVAVRDPVATVVEIDPIVAVINVAQHDVAELAVGKAATLKTITGKRVDGRVRYISAQADAETRTFRVEIEVPNKSGRLLAGSSVEVSLPVEQVKAHFISPQHLSLSGKNESGLGVKTVDAQGVVRFLPVRLVRTTTSGAWVSGLPETVRLIVRGHGFVEAGQRVGVTEVKAAGARPAAD